MIGRLAGKHRRHGRAPARGRGRRPSSPCRRRRPCRRSCRFPRCCPPRRADRRRSGTRRRGRGRRRPADAAVRAAARPRMAPDSALNWISRPVFSACNRVTSAASRSRPSASMSIICPPTMPRAPAAAPSAEHQLAACQRVGMGVGLGQHLEGAGLQGVAGQDGGRLVEGAMAGRLAAAQVVVVHRRQVVVHQGIGVQHLDRRGHPCGAGRPRRRTAPRSRSPGSRAAACRRRGPRSASPRPAAPPAPPAAAAGYRARLPPRGRRAPGRREGRARSAVRPAERSCALGPYCGLGTGCHGRDGHIGARKECRRCPEHNRCLLLQVGHSWVGTLRSGRHDIWWV